MRVVQARRLMPLMFIAHEPQMPSRQERRKVSVESIAALIWISASSTIGPQLLVSSSKVSMRGFSPESGIEAVDAERCAASRAPARRRVRDALDGCGSWRAGGIRPSQSLLSRCAPWAGSTRPRRSGCSDAPGDSRSAPVRAPRPRRACASSSSTSSRCGKSSRACAPRLSVRLAAEWMVAVACSSRFSSSSVSMRSVFQTSERSATAHVGEGGEGRADALDALRQALAGAEHGGIELHGLLHLEADRGGRPRCPGRCAAGRGARAPARRRRPRAARGARRA